MAIFTKEMATFIDEQIRDEHEIFFPVQELLISQENQMMLGKN